MKKTILCFWLVCLIAMLLCVSVFSLTSYTDSTDERFLFGRLMSDNTDLSVMEDGGIELSFRRTAPCVSADIELPAYEIANNAIRIVATNHSACSTLTVTYRYFDAEGMTKTATERFSLEARGIAGEYYIFTDMADRLTHLELVFSGTSTGRIVLGGVSVCSVVPEHQDALGNINSCRYINDGEQVRVRGNVRYDIMTENRTASIALYAVRLGQSTVPYNAKPIATTPMSSYFDFRVDAPRGSSRFCAYIVAVCDENGGIRYAFEPRVPCSETAMAEDDGFLKGAYTENDIAAARADSDMLIVEADVSRMLSAAGNGYMYALDGLYYYFDRSYIAAIDAKVKNGYENGMQVYLRLTAPQSAETGLPGLVGFNDMHSIRLFAASDFLLARYGNASRGVVSGVVLGDAVSLSEIGGISLARYTERFSESLYAVHEAIASQERTIRLVVPVLDGDERDSASHIFLMSLVNRIRGRFCGGLPFTVMIEERELLFPDVSNVDTLFYSGSFVSRLQRLYSGAYERYLCYWSPEGDGIRASYLSSLVLSYYTAVLREEVLGYILSPDSGEDGELTEELFDLYLYLDTQNGVTAVDRLLSSYGLGDWRELLDSFSDKLTQTSLYRMTTSPGSPPFRFLGEAYLWDFAGIANDYGWYGASGCESLAMKKDKETGRALVADMLPDAANRFTSELVYRYSTPVYYRSVDAVSFDLRFDALVAGEYRVTVQICTDNSVSEAKLDCKSGVLTRVYVNLSGLSEDETITCIRIFAKPENEESQAYSLSVGSITAHSTTARGADLADMIARNNRVDLSIYEKQKEPIKVGWIYVLVLALFVGVTVIATLSLRSDEERKD